jgi:elongator complex protein 2
MAIHQLLNITQGIAAITSSTIYFASSDSQAKILIWKLNEEGADLVQQIKLGTQHALCMSLTKMPRSDVSVLFIGQTDCKIHIYVEKDGVFTKVSELKGHTDWVKSISVAVVSSNTESYTEGDLIVATSSKDKYIRLWKVSNATLQSSFDALQVNADGGITLSTKAHVIKAAGNEYAVSLDAVLIGHEDWVHSVTWHPEMCVNGTKS